MSQPDDVLIEFFKTLQGDLMILGIGGKIGTELGFLLLMQSKHPEWIEEYMACRVSHVMDRMPF